MEKIATLSQIKAGIKAGFLNDVYKQVRRYGVIKDTVNFQYHGREALNIEISYKGLLFEFELHNGEVVSGGYVIE